jgi:YidC/Oxa1 family membrane protein insertase
MFEFLANLFHIFLYQPLFNCLVFLYTYVPGKDIGIAIILLTILIKILLYPTSAKAVISQLAMQKLQPRMKEIQEKYKDDKEKQAHEMLELYKKEKVNPFSGLLIQIPIIIVLIALYKVFMEGFNPEALTVLYKFIPNPGEINHMFFQVIDLAKPNLWLAILAGITQYFQAKTLMPQKQSKNLSGSIDTAAMIQKQTLYFFPIITIVILMGLPSALGLYWATSSVLSVLQQELILKKNKKLELQNK